FPDLSALSGWSGSTGGNDPTNPYASPADYSWTAGAAEPGAKNITATDKATNNNTDTITIKDDTSAPTGQTITLTGANPPYYTSTSVSFTLGDGNDGTGSGLDTSTRTVTRETGTLTANSCNSFSADAGTYTSPDNTVTTGHCYRYTYTIKDNVSNTSTPVTTTAKVDTSTPSTPTFAWSSLTNAYAAGSTVWYLPTAASGSFTVTASSNDPETGVQAYTF